jgi:hypothetical protein
VGGAVFKTVEAEDLGLGGSIPLRLRYLQACAFRGRELWRGASICDTGYARYVVDKAASKGIRHGAADVENRATEARLQTADILEVLARRLERQGRYVEAARARRRARNLGLNPDAAERIVDER